MAPAAVTQKPPYGAGWQDALRAGLRDSEGHWAGRGGASGTAQAGDGISGSARQRHSASFMSTFSPQVRTLTLRGRQDRRPRGHRGPRRHCGWPGADCRLPPREGWSVGGAGTQSLACR